MISPDKARARLALARPADNDQAALASLERDCGLLVGYQWAGTGETSRLASVRLTRKPGFDIGRARKIIAALNVPCDERTAVVALTDLAAVTARRPEDTEEADITFQAYLRRLIEYPPDVVLDCCKEAGDQERWFPTWYDLRLRLDRAVAMRRMIRRQLDLDQTPEIPERIERAPEERELLARAIKIMRKNADDPTMTAERCKELAQAELDREKNPAAC